MAAAAAQFASSHFSTGSALRRNLKITGLNIELTQLA
jgi:hypothetical protein